MKKKILIFIALLAIVSAVVMAQEPEVSKTVTSVEMEVNENGLVKVTQNVELSAQAEVYQSDITIPGAKDIEIYDSSGILEYDVIPSGNEEILNFYLSKPINPGERRTVTVIYSTDFFTSKQGSMWELSFILSVTNGSTIKVTFPKNVIISFTSSEVVPSTYIEGNRQVLELESAGEEIDFLCEYRFLEATAAVNESVKPQVNGTAAPELPQETPEGKKPGGYFLILLALAVMIIIIFAVLRYYSKSGKKESPVIGEKEKTETKKEEGKEKEKEKEVKDIKPKEVKSSIIKLLSENERNIIEILEKSGGEVTQAYLYKSTKIPRSTLSKMMQTLEERNIIERRSEGKTRWVRLKEWVFE
jgi:uncharacterized membrane protein